MVAVCLVGISTGPAAFSLASIGLFIGPLQQEFGWSVTSISSAVTAMMLTTAFSLNIAGRLVDRFGPKAVLAPSVATFGLCLLAVPFLAREYWMFVAIYVAMGTIAVGSNSIAYIRLLASWFDKSRGLAICIAGSGTGLGFAYVPLLVQHFIGEYGWRGGYIGLSAIMLLVTLPLVLFVLRDKPSELGLGVDGGELHKPASETGQSPLEAARTWPFWNLLAVFVALSFVLHGLIPHLVPMLTARGVDVERAASIASLFGLASFAGRILIGSLVDWLDARRVAAVFIAISALGVGLLAADLPLFAFYVAAFLLGGTLGAEVDLLAFLVSRYFGLRSFAQLFGLMFGVVMVGMGLGPLAFGIVFDVTGSYRAMLAVATPVCAICVILMSILPRYTHAAASRPIRGMYFTRLREAQQKRLNVVRRLPATMFGPIAEALRNRTFALYSAGNFTNFAGAWMQRIILGWIVWELTHSGLWLAVLVLCDLGPALLMAPLGGVLGDRGDQARLILKCQALFLLNGLILAAVAAWGDAPVGVFIVFAFLGGVFNALSDAARVSIIRRLTTTEELAASIAIASVIFNLARFLGPAVGGVLLATVGAGPALAVAALVGGPFLYILSQIGPMSANTSEERAQLFRPIARGFSYVASHAEIARFFILFGLTCLLVRPAYEVMPGIVGEVLNGDVSDFTLLVSAAGLGALVAALNLSRLTDGVAVEPVIARGCYGSGISLIFLALSPTIFVAVIAALALGYSISMTANGTLIAVQMRSSLAFQSRVASVWVIIVRAGPALGALLIGWTADQIGFKPPLLAGAALCVIGAWLATSRFGSADRGARARQGD